MTGTASHDRPVTPERVKKHLPPNIFLNGKMQFPFNNPTPPAVVLHVDLMVDEVCVTRWNTTGSISQCFLANDQH